MKPLNFWSIEKHTYLNKVCLHLCIVWVAAKLNKGNSAMTWIGPIKLFWKVAIKIVLWCCQILWQALHESRHQKRFNKHILTLSRHSITFESEVILIFVTVSMYQLSNYRVLQCWTEGRRSTAVAEVLGHSYGCRWN